MSNIVSFQVEEMLEVAEKYIAKGDLDWERILDLENHSVPIIFIQALDRNAKQVASVTWCWNDKELKFGKVEVAENLRNRI